MQRPSVSVLTCSLLNSPFSLSSIKGRDGEHLGLILFFTSPRDSSMQFSWEGVWRCLFQNYPRILVHM